MTRVFPPQFKALAKAAETKAMFVSEVYTNPDPKACKNCGGIGMIYAFVATRGPYQYVPNQSLISHWSEEGWWVGGTFGFPCPVCNPAGDKDEAR